MGAALPDPVAEAALELAAEAALLTAEAAEDLYDC